jgi:Carboxypeptidase regulatory-like domain/TonB-dependent Receptor Plug Domain
MQSEPILRSARCARGHGGPGPGWLIVGWTLICTITAVSRTSAQSTEVLGQLVDSATSAPIVEAVVTLDGTPYSVLTDTRGSFILRNVQPGRYTLRVSHVAYGEKAVEVEIEAGRPARLLLRLSGTTIALEPLEVQAFTAEQLRARAAGFRRNIVTRDQMALAENTSLTIADVMRVYFPTVRVRREDRIVGGETCIELRSIRTIGRRSPCLSPAVYVDGVPIMNPTPLYGSLDPRVIESIEVVPASEAGARYGTGALYGALLIETLRPGAANAEERNRQLASGPRSFDWSQESGSHPFTRSFAFSMVGNAAGLALGLVAANQCIGTQRPSNDRVIAKCDAWPTFGSAAAALALPAMGAGLGSWIGGRTDGSRGRFMPAAVGATMALVPGYALILSSRRSDSGPMYWLGTTVLALGVPFVTTISDHLFRDRRHKEDPLR